MRIALTILLLTAALPLAAQPVLQVTFGSPTGQVVHHQASPMGTPRDFGARDTGAGPSAAITLCVTNAGTGTLDLTVPHMAGVWWWEFVTNTTGMQLQLAAGQSTTFTVAFDPTTVGQRDAYVRFAHTDATQASPFYAPVTGQGTGTSAPPPAMSLEHAGATITGWPYNIGVVPWLTSSSHTFTVRNSGAGELFLQGPEYVDMWATGGCTAVVSVQPTSPIAPGATSDFTIDVTPSSSSFCVYTIQIRSNAAGTHLFSFEADVQFAATELRVATQPAGAVAGTPFGTSAVVAVTDSNGVVDTSNSTTVVQASIVAGTGTLGAVLGGTTTLTVQNGYAVFTALEIDLPGTGYRLEFVDASGVLSATTSAAFDVSASGQAIIAGGSGTTDEADPAGCAVSASATAFIASMSLLAPLLARTRRRRCG
jgi:hypothetical protein